MTRSLCTLCFLILMTMFTNPGPLAAFTPTEIIPPRADNPTLPFIANEGQWRKSVSFRAMTPEGPLFVTENGDLVYSLADGTLLERFDGGNAIRPRGGSPATTRVNWIKGADPSAWRSEIATFNHVTLGEVYAGIDVTLVARRSNVEKLFTVAVGADPERIRVDLPTADKLEVTETGQLLALTAMGPVTFTTPIAYQEHAGGRRLVPVAYRIDGLSYGFDVGEYDRELPLVIDPLLASTYVGGSSDDDTYEPSVAVDAEGNVYLSGFTASSDFPRHATGYDRFKAGATDRFVAKFSPDLQTLLAATFIGGNGYEFGMGITFDADGNVYLGGYTNSGATFPAVSGGYISSSTGALDAFVVKLDSDLTTLLAATRFGGTNDEGYRWPRIDLAVGGDGDLYVTGLTKSTDFPIVDGYDTSYAGGGTALQGGDVFIARFDAELTTLKASTYLGGSEDEWRVSLVLDNEDNVFVCGTTLGAGFPTTPGCFDPTCNPIGQFDVDMFISRFNSDLNTLVASTFYGSDYKENPLAMRIDGNGDIFIGGYTTSGDCPVPPDGLFTTYGGGERDVVIAKFSPDLTELLAGTFIGGMGKDTAEDIILDGQGHIYVAGVTTYHSVHYPVNADNCYDDTPNGGEDCFVSKLTVDLRSMPASTLIGGSGDDKAQGIALGGNGVYICGTTTSSNYPLAGVPYQNGYAGGGNDCFISRFDLDLSSDSTPVAPEQPQPQGLRFEGNYPNPFNPQTRIRYSLDAASEVRIDIFNTRGQLIATLEEGFKPGGAHEARWRADGLPSGSYNLRICAGDRYCAGRVIMLK
ncbi:MAG: hypothetical protein GY835_08445 [bacterium]|nr:hypothetical protein [bacterium]